jgi:hypothetical protein
MNVTCLRYLFNSNADGSARLGLIKCVSPARSRGSLSREVVMRLCAYAINRKLGIRIDQGHATATASERLEIVETAERGG